MASRPCRAAVNNTMALSKKRLQPFSRAWYNPTTKKPLYQLCFSSSKDPPPSGQDEHTEKDREGRSYTSSNTTEVSKNELHGSFQHDQKPIQRFKNFKRKEWKQKQTRRRKHQHHQHQHQQRENNTFLPSLVQYSQYSYKVCSGRDVVSSSGFSSSSPHQKNGNAATATVMQSMNASALLDPLNYCKSSTKLTPHVNNGSRSINGTDAARRLLRGKKDFLLAARKLNNNAPVLLDGHGVPPALFQHCVDMADALLRHYGPDVVECSFHNYYNGNKNNGSSKAPLHVRVRRRDATNACLPPPSINDTPPISNSENTNSNSGEKNSEIDWDHNLTLYLTVMVSSLNAVGI